MDQTSLARSFQNRLGFGPLYGDVGGAGEAPARWLEEQLRPPEGDDTQTVAKLAAVKLHIKYDAKDQHWAALDEMRPLALLDQPIEAVWPLTDGNKVAGPERGRGRDEVAAATLTRAIYSRWQLREVLADFWHNHFNVNATGGDAISVALPSYDREVIRRHCLGNFRDMLEAVGSHAAMLIYLNNRSSRAGEANENYGRELFELHTLGSPHYLNALYDRWKAVPGAMKGTPTGYIDGDVYEAARAFTGWAIEDGSGIGGGQNLPATGKFVYVDSWHDNYQKRVLATEFDPFSAPMSDGRKVFDLVGFHPGTAQYVCTKLCRRLVGDAPPTALVAKAVEVWNANHRSPDQIAQVVRAIALSHEFTAAPAQKIKRPLELVASFVRATGIDFTVNDTMLHQLDGSGQRLFGWVPPTGHPDTNDYWLGTNGMRQRLSLLFGIALNYWQTGVFQPAAEVPVDASSQSAAEYLLARMVPPEDVAALVPVLLRGLNWAPEAPVKPEGSDRQDGLRKLAVFAAMTPPFQVR